MACLLVPLVRDVLSPRGSLRASLKRARLMALCALTVLFVACMFLNPLVYIFVMAPLAMLLGTCYPGAAVATDVPKAGREAYS